MKSASIFNSKLTHNNAQWIIIDDVVMGGKSNGEIKTNSDGKVCFHGIISLENNGGFSSVRYRPEQISTRGFTKIKFLVKGDGKRYQFRLKENLNDRHSYVNYFTTNGNWETITINLHDLFPKFRGKQLDIPNFEGSKIEEVGFLFGNKKAESFELFIDNISLE